MITWLPRAQDAAIRWVARSTRAWRQARGHELRRHRPMAHLRPGTRLRVTMALSGRGAGDLLEQLCFYRSLYALRGRDDREPIMSVEAAVARAEMRLRAARILDHRAARRNIRPAA
jgi:hypothetical protein